MVLRIVADREMTLGLYDIAMHAGRGAITALGRLHPDRNAGKFKRFCRGQITASEAVEAAMQRLTEGLPTVWVHCASLGEYGIARPIIAELRRRRACNVVLTFFSPTGYEALHRRMDAGEKVDADAVLYLPLDTRKNARRFLDAVKPVCALFMVSEFWHNYLNELNRRGIPTMLVSAIIRRDSALMRPYGGIYRQSARCFSRIFALDEPSVERLRQSGVTTASVNGDPLFDNAVIVASTPWNNDALERFAAGREVFIAGSLHHDADLDLLAGLAEKHPELPMIIVPHEITPTMLDAVDRRITGRTLRLSAIDADTDLTGVRGIVVDNVGQLAYLYRLGRWAYVGGGFTRLLHSVIEPVVYGLPVAFVPKTGRKVTPAQLIAEGIGARLTDAGELTAWFESLNGDTARLNSIADSAKKYVARNSGATARVVDAVVEAIENHKAEMP